MITMRRYFTGGPNKRLVGPIISPGCAAVTRNGGSGGGLLPSPLLVSPQKQQQRPPPVRQHSHQPQYNNKRRRYIERLAVAIMLLIAWAWIMVFFGMIFYHGYQYNRTGAGENDVAKDATIRQQNADRIGDNNDDKIRRSIIRETFVLDPHGSPLLIFTCQRAEYLQETLKDILNFIPSDCSMGCPVVVSQDGDKNPDVNHVISDFQTKFLERKGISLIHLQHKSAVRRGSKSVNSYEALAVHYGWALRQVFDGHATASPKTRLPQRVLILEEDLHISPDFFNYFAAMAPFLDTDPSLLAVSAFNDNGFEEHVKDPTRVLRSDFFPGLGWMLTRKLWTNELQLKWPGGYWDDWLREPAQRQGRHVLRPEVSRTFHFGEKGGASHNQFGGKLQKVHLNKEEVDWNQRHREDRNHWAYYLQDEETYDRHYWSLLQNARLETTVMAVLEKSKEMDVRIEYESFGKFKSLAKQLNLMDDEKAGIPRTAYKGVIETRPHQDHFIFVTPPMAQLQKEFAGHAAATIAEDPARQRR